jgi:endonuclease/exonuclease/phosphatase family metal-dependent hydrolase
MLADEGDDHGVNATHSLRVCSWNVHGFVDARGQARLPELIAFLESITPDVVCMNEVPGPEGHLRQVADALGLHACWGPAAFAGNAILSRAPVSEVERCSLSAPGHEARGALVVDLPWPGAPDDAVTLACTHLDHRHEAARLPQLDQLARALAARRPCALLAGDLNALRLADYGADRREELRSSRAARGWEEAASDVVERLDALGYVDAVRFGGRFADAPLPAELAATCWTGTRVDYVWLSGTLAARARRVEVEVRADCDVSDHLPVVVDLELA